MRESVIFCEITVWGDRRVSISETVDRMKIEIGVVTEMK